MASGLAGELVADAFILMNRQRLKKFIALILPIIILSIGANCMVNTLSHLTDMLPEDFAGWKISGQDKTYTSKNLHEYINGGAELYISYGFQNSLSRKYTANDQPDILVDLFNMGTSQNAFGVFSHSRETEDELFGQGSQYVPGLLLFWKDRYFVSILANPETARSKEAVFHIAKRIESAIPTDGMLPEILKLLPEEHLVKESIFYFRHYIWLNAYYFIAHENILHITGNTEAIFAKYQMGEQRSILLIIKYPEEAEAKKASSGFSKHYLPELSTSEVVKIEDNTWTGCRRAGNHLIIIFNAPDKVSAIKFIGKTIEKLNR